MKTNFEEFALKISSLKVNNFKLGESRTPLV